MSKKPLDPKIYERLVKAEDDLESGRISRRAFNKILTLAAASAGVTFAELNPVHAWVATRMRKRRSSSTATLMNPSLRFDAALSTGLTRTPSSAGNRRKWTFSTWVKRGNLSGGSYGCLFGTGGLSGTANDFILCFDNLDRLSFYRLSTNILVTNAVYRDTAAWSHVVLTVDGDHGIPDLRNRLFVNGTEVTSFAIRTNLSAGTDYPVNSTIAHVVGQTTSGNYFFDGLMSETYFVDGQALTPASFGAADPSTGQWLPKQYAGSFGTNGFYLPYKSNSATGGSGTASGSYPSVSGVPGLGADYSGNNNHWSATGFATTDQLLDCPANNFCTLNPLTVDPGTYSRGNLRYAGPGAWNFAKGTMQVPPTGKWAFSAKIVTAPYSPRASNSEYSTVGLVLSSQQSANGNFIGTDRIVFCDSGYYSNFSASPADSGFTMSNGDRIEMLIDRDANTYAFKRGAVTMASGTLGAAAGTELHPVCGDHTSTYGLLDFDFGQGGYTPSDSSYKLLCTANLPTPAILKPSQYFTVATYTGNGGVQRIGDTIPSASTYQISKSLRFQSAASAYLSRSAMSGAGLTQATFSVWVKRSSFGSNQYLFSSGRSASQRKICWAYFDTSDCLVFGAIWNDASSYGVTSSRSFKDGSAWHHFVFVLDTSNATAGNRMLIYCDGQLLATTPSGSMPQGTLIDAISSSFPMSIGYEIAFGSSPFDGEMTELNFVDGQALSPSSFGQTDSTSGDWVPKAYGGTYGTNGFSLNFLDSSNTTAATLGKDYSGNGNNWTPANFTLLDSLLDTPTKNFPTWNPLSKMESSAGISTFFSGNLTTRVPASSAYAAYILSTLSIPTSGKWYWEVTGDNVTNAFSVGVTLLDGQNYSNFLNLSYIYDRQGTQNIRGSSVSFASPYTTNDRVGVAFDADKLKVWYSVNGAWQASGAPSTGANPAATVAPGTYAASVYLCSTNGGGQNSATVNFGQGGQSGLTYDSASGGSFKYTPPSGFKALCTGNNPAISTGAMQSTPDLVWIKSRSNATDHGLYDTSRGAMLDLSSSNISATESTQPASLTQFTKTGFSVGSLAKVNNVGDRFVAWMWKKGLTPGFDIVTYTGDGNSGQTISHSLGQAPALIIGKPRTVAGSWCIYHKNMATSGITGGCLFLDAVNGFSSGRSTWNSTLPGSSSFTVGGLDLNRSATPHVAYLWAEIPGFSKFGSYTGNGSTNGPFHWCGFQPKFVLVKRIDSAGNWHLIDTARDIYNSSGLRLLGNASSTEADTRPRIDFLSNGFKNRDTDPDFNASGGSYIYVAFAEAPFKNALAR